SRDAAGRSGPAPPHRAAPRCGNRRAAENTPYPGPERREGAVRVRAYVDLREQRVRVSACIVSRRTGVPQTGALAADHAGGSIVQPGLWTGPAECEPMETKRPTNPAAEEILGQYFPVLDHGFVSLVDYMGGDDSIERAARVSYGYGTRRSSQTRGLVRYLRRHLHTTPSEMVELKFHCAMPMFVARQWIRHRTANVNEYSGRYSLIPLLF